MFFVKNMDAHHFFKAPFQPPETSHDGHPKSHSKWRVGIVLINGCLSVKHYPTRAMISNDSNCHSPTIPESRLHPAVILIGRVFFGDNLDLSKQWHIIIFLF